MRLSYLSLWWGHYTGNTVSVYWNVPSYAGVCSLTPNEIQLQSAFFHWWYRTGLIPGLGLANEWRRYKVTPSLFGWAQTWNQPCSMSIKYRDDFDVICYVVVIIWLWGWSLRSIQPYFQSCFTYISAIIIFPRYMWNKEESTLRRWNMAVQDNWYKNILEVIEVIGYE